MSKRDGDTLYGQDPHSQVSDQCGDNYSFRGYPQGAESTTPTTDSLEYLALKTRRSCLWRARGLWETNSSLKGCTQNL